MTGLMTKAGEGLRLRARPPLGPGLMEDPQHHGKESHQPEQDDHRPLRDLLEPLHDGKLTPKQREATARLRQDPRRPLSLPPRDPGPKERSLPQRCRCRCRCRCQTWTKASNGYGFGYGFGYEHQHEHERGQGSGGSGGLGPQPVGGAPGPRRGSCPNFEKDGSGPTEEGLEPTEEDGLCDRPAAEVVRTRQPEIKSFSIAILRLQLLFRERRRDYEARNCLDRWPAPARCGL